MNKLALFRAMFAVMTVVSIALATMLFYRNPLPIPDRGHRCFPVPSEVAASIVSRILGEKGGLPERFTFKTGHTTQTLAWDNTTVLIQYDDYAREQGLALPILSIVSKDPVRDAKEASELLRRYGFTAETVKNPDSDVGNKLVVLQSDAFSGWLLVFRLSILEMGEMPKTRHLKEY